METYSHFELMLKRPTIIMIITAKNYISTSAPHENGENMGVKYLSGGRTQVKISYRDKNGPSHKQKTIKSRKRSDIAKTILLLESEITGCSLTNITFSECVEHYLKLKDNGSFIRSVRLIEKKLGKYKVDNKFRDHVMMFRNSLEAEISESTHRPLTNGTINRYMAFIRSTLKYAYKTGVIDSIPAIDFSMKRERVRNRMLDEYEETKLLNTLRIHNSYLEPAVRFSLRNPIRAGDLFGLTIDNLDLFNGYVFFHQKKTGHPTYLIVWDDYIRNYFGNLKGTRYLFHNNGEKVGLYRKHWETMLRYAGIENFRFHDLRRCAGTWMLRNGFSERDIIDLGLWKSLQMVYRYYHGDAFRIIDRYQEKSHKPVAVS